MYTLNKNIKILYSINIFTTMKKWFSNFEIINMIIQHRPSILNYNHQYTVDFYQRICIELYYIPKFRNDTAIKIIKTARLKLQWKIA